MTRYWELDFIRGLAIIGMVIFHSLFDLNHFTNLPVTLPHWLTTVVAPIGAGLFILIAGISISLRYHRQKEIKTKKELRWSFIKRGLIIFSLGLLLSFSTWLLFPDAFIRFGILHLIGISTILSYPLIQRPRTAGTLGILILLTGLSAPKLTTNNPYLFWLGNPGNHFQSLDYFPLLPWLGVFLLGIPLSQWLYSNGQRRFSVPHQPRWIGFIALAGQHTLAIYLLHQPLLFTLLYLFGVLTI